MSVALSVFYGIRKWDNYRYKKRRQQEKVSELAAIKEDIQSVVEEVKPNGGKSLGDKVNRIENNVEHIKNRQEEHIVPRLYQAEEDIKQKENK